MHWTLKHYDELTRDELYEILRLRCQVFIVEQDCVYDDVDGLDRTAWHLLARDGRGMLCACLRAIPRSESEPMHLGRVVVRPDCRGSGLGRELVRRGLEAAHDALGEDKVAISAQAHLQRFYESLGFRAVTEPYDLTGILHIDMQWKAE